MAVTTKTRSALHERAQDCCERCGRRGATNAHHRRNQSQGGHDGLSNLMLLCGSGTMGCHGFITTTPTIAKRMGWTVRRISDPADVEVWRFDRTRGELVRVLLADDGTITPAAYFADQSLFAGQAVLGDCWRVCVANLLRVPPADVPHFVELHRGPGEWYLQTLGWLAKHHGIELQRRAPEFPLTSEREHIILCGLSPRGDFQHAVLADAAGNIVHDPHPSRDGLRTVEDAYIAVAA